MWHKHWTETIYEGQCLIFHGPVILPYILKTIWWTNVIIGILDPCDAKIYHIKCMWVRYLPFMVQWLCLISWRLFDGLMLYWRYWFNGTQTLNWNIYIGQWPIFHGPVILPYILQTIWCQQPTFCGPVILTYDGGMLDWRYWFSVTLSLTYNYICRSVTFILWFSDSALYFQYYLMNKPHSLDIDSDKGHWPVFHD